MGPGARYAVVGMDCVLPGALGAEAWIGLRSPQFREVPAGRWPMPSGGVRGEAPNTAWGAFVDVLPEDEAWQARGYDPLFGWVVRVVGNALPAGADRRRTSLALACLGLPSTGSVRAAAAPALEALGRDVPWLRRRGEVPPDERQPAFGPARVAAVELGLGGEVDALDAACASGLFAVRAAIDRLAAGSCDTAVAAAVNRSDAAYLAMGFSRLLALSRSGVARPLDVRADGLVVGEGAVAVAIRRLDDALRDGDPVHAVIRAVGVGSDGRKGNMLSPDASSQVRAMRSAWAAAGLDPAAVGAVECHATGTLLGDGTELRALTELLRDRRGPPAVLSTAKGLVGHTVTAAGLAGLVRAIGAVRDGVLPAASGCEQPRQELLASRALTALTAPTPWDATVRIAAVSAFGFGGTNAHLVLERFVPGEAGAVPLRAPPALAVVAVADRIGPDRDGAGPTPLRPAEVRHTRGLGPTPLGRWVDEVAVDPWRFKIPPAEVAEILPQQLLALELAADAAERCPRLDPARTGAVIGFEVDPQVGDVVVRWALLADDPAATADADAVAPPLTAARVQGALPNFVACRIAAQLGLEGPSYAVSAGAASGIRALAHAAALLADGGLDVVLVGAVDVRGPGLVDVEGGAVLAVRRLADAEAAGDPVLAVLRVEAPGVLGANGSAAADLFDVVRAIRATATAWVSGLDVAPRRAPPEPGPDRWSRALVVPHSLPALAPSPAPGPGRALTSPLRWPPGEGESRPGSPGTVGPLTPSLSPEAGEREPVGPGLDPALTSPLRWPPGSRPGSPGTVGPLTPSLSPEAGERGPSGWPGPGLGPAHPVTSPCPPLPLGEGGGEGRDPWPARRVVSARTEAAATPSVEAQLDVRSGRAGAGAGAGAELARATARALRAATDAHAAFLDAQDRATAPLAALAEALARAARPSPTASPPPLPRTARPSPTPSAPPLPRATRPSPTPSPPPLPRTARPSPTPSAPPLPRTGGEGRGEGARPAPRFDARIGGAPSAPSDRLRERVAYDRAALLRHAGGTLASVFGPAWADLDAYEPRVRMPLPPLLLVDRVLAVEGTRDELGPARIVTEYDVPHGAGWSADGRPPACVVVESGQADLFLVSYLGLDGICRGERRYRLLDCDLRFLGDRPRPGTTLRHDIRIDRFARHAGTTLFWFRYDCTDAATGAPVLEMRDGCAGFFTPAELARPRGLPAAAPRPSGPRAPVAVPSALDDADVAALVRPGLGLPPDPRWRLVHRAPTLTADRIVAEQDLHDDDWFNAVHFQGDPCMPGTLMLEGCLQTVQTWLLASGVRDRAPRGRFDVGTGAPIRLRCRGQVAPGHRRLVYDARIVASGPTWAEADVILSVDGTPVVRAGGVTVRVVDTPGASD